MVHLSIGGGGGSTSADQVDHLSMSGEGGSTSAGQVNHLSMSGKGEVQVQARWII